MLIANVDFPAPSGSMKFNNTIDHFVRPVKTFTETFYFFLMFNDFSPGDFFSRIKKSPGEMS